VASFRRGGKGGGVVCRVTNSSPPSLSLSLADCCCVFLFLFQLFRDHHVDYRSRCAYQY
jgi:hypothetical protein